MLRLVVETGGDGPAPPAGAPINRWRDDHGQVFAEAFVSSSGYRLTWSGVGDLSFAPPLPAVTLRPVAGASLAWLDDVFTRIIQPVILPAYGWQALHASAAVTPAGAIAFCGESGAGKSTMAFACGQARGCRQVADDAVVVEARSRRPHVRLFPYQPRLREASRAFFSGQDPGSGSAGRVDLTEAPLLAMVMLEQQPDSASPFEVSLVAPVTAFRQLLAHAHVLDPTNRMATSALVSGFLSLAADVRVYTLRYRPAFEDLSSIVDHLVNRIGAAETTP